MLTGVLGRIYNGPIFHGYFRNPEDFDIVGFSNLADLYPIPYQGGMVLPVDDFTYEWSVDEVLYSTTNELRLYKPLQSSGVDTVPADVDWSFTEVINGEASSIHRIYIKLKTTRISDGAYDTKAIFSSVKWQPHINNSFPITVATGLPAYNSPFGVYLGDGTRDMSWQQLDYSV